MASLTVDELRQIRGGGIRGDSRAQSKRTHPEKAADDSSKAIPDEKQEKARKIQEVERKRVGHVQEQRKIPEPKTEEGATPAIKIAADEKREKARKLREQQEQERLRKLEAQKFKEEERTQAALDKKREVLLAAQKIQEERKMKSAEPTKGSDEHMEKVKKAREQLEIEKKKRLEAQLVKDQQKMLAASDKKKPLHPSAQTKLDDRTKTSGGTTTVSIKKVTQISAPKKAAGSQHLPSKKAQPHSTTVVHGAGLPEPSAAGSKDQNSATAAALHSSTAPSAGTDNVPVVTDDTSMESGPAATHSDTTATASGDGSESSANSELVEGHEEGPGVEGHEEGPGVEGHEEGPGVEGHEEGGGNNVLGEEERERLEIDDEGSRTGDEGSRTSIDMEPPGAPSKEEQDKDKDMAHARIEQEAAERRKRVDEIMKKAREKHKKQSVQDVVASQELSLTPQKSSNHNEDPKDAPEQGEGSSDGSVSHGLGGGDASGHEGFLEGSLHSTSNISPHSGDQVAHSGDQVTHNGDQVIHSGDQVIHSGDQVIHSGDQVAHSGDQVTHSVDPIHTHIDSELSVASHSASNEIVPHAGLALDTVEPAADAASASNLAGSDQNNEAVSADDLIQAGGGQSVTSEEALLCHEAESGDRPHPLQHEPSDQLPRPFQDQFVEGLPPQQDQLTNGPHAHQDVPQNVAQVEHLECSVGGGGELGGGGGGEENPPDLPISDPPTEAPAGEGGLDHHGDIPAVDPNGNPSGHVDNGLHQRSSSLGDDHLIVSVCEGVHESEADQSSTSSVNFEEGEGSSDVLKLLEED